MNKILSETESTATFQAQQLSCVRGDRLLFENLSINVHAGEMLQIFGANGSGKTTLLRILCGLLKPDAGTVTWRGQSIDADTAAFHAALLYIGHTNGIKLDLSPLENCRFATALSTQTAKISPEQALERLGLAGFEDEPVHTLSAGQRRRTALARVLTSHAKVWILDELFTSLDQQSNELMQQIIHQHLCDGGIAILTSHHSLDFTDQPTHVLRLHA